MSRAMESLEFRTPLQIKVQETRAKILEDYKAIAEQEKDRTPTEICRAIARRYGYSLQHVLNLTAEERRN